MKHRADRIGSIVEDLALPQVAPEEAPTAGRNRFRPLRALTALIMATAIPVAVIGESNTMPDQHASGGVEAAEIPDYQKVTFDYEDDINMYHDPLVSPEPDYDMDPTAVVVHWWGPVEADGKDQAAKVDMLATILRSRTDACGDTGCSVQYAIVTGGNGKYQMMKDDRQVAYHARGANYSSVGIEMQGSGPEDFAVDGPAFDAEKFEDGVELIYLLTKKHDIQLEPEIACDASKGVITHAELDPCAGTGKTDVTDEYRDALVWGVEWMQQHAPDTPAAG